MKQDITSLNSVLGDASVRYFAYGFSQFEFQINSFRLKETDQLLGTLALQYQGPTRPQKEPLHIGSIEYFAMALFLAEGILIKQKRLTRDELNRSFLSGVSMRIKKSHLLAANSDIPFEVAIADSRLDLSAINVGLTTIRIRIQDAIVQLVIDHPGPTHIDFQDYDLWPFSQGALHRMAYKERQLHVDHIVLDRQAENITAQLRHPAANLGQPWGIAASSNLLTGLDSIRISGQLMQVLLYSLLNTSREDCPNIWLRSMELQFDRPYHSTFYHIELHFIKRQQSVFRGKPWQTIQLSSQIGNMNATYKICHEMPS